MKIGQTLNYFGELVEVVDLNSTHVLIKFKNGMKICTNRNTFEK